jgi:hypothetical protein
MCHLNGIRSADALGIAVFRELDARKLPFELALLVCQERRTLIEPTPTRMAASQTSQ